MLKLEKYSPEYVEESEKIIGLLQAALRTPEDANTNRAVVNSLEKLGFIEPRTPVSSC